MENNNRAGCMKRHTSPYLSSNYRLADVLAGIQVMGAYTLASCEGSVWAEKLGGPRSAQDWGTIFDEHPEFFRVSDGWVSLRWRHGYDPNFSVSLSRELSYAEVEVMSQEDKKALTRKALTSDQIEALLQIAIALHSRGIAHAEEGRWLKRFLFGLAGTIIGVVLQAALK